MNTTVHSFYMSHAFVCGFVRVEKKKNPVTIFNVLAGILQNTLIVLPYTPQGTYIPQHRSVALVVH